MNGEVRFGYTMADLDRLARVAVHRAWAHAMDYTDRYEAAWHAIAERLYADEPRPSARDLIEVGARAVDRFVQDEHRHHGYDRSNPDAGYEGMPAFQRYWSLHRTLPSPDLVVDRVAHTQIWPTLSRTHQQVVLAFAVHADHKAAAEAFGRGLPTYRSHLRLARQAYRELWHEHETPSAMWGQSRGRQGRRTAAQTLQNRIQQRKRRARKTAA